MKTIKRILSQMSISKPQQKFLLILFSTIMIGVSKNAVLRLFFLHSFWIHHEKTVNILVHCWDHENKP